MTRVALNRRIDAGRLMAQLASAFSYCCMPQLGYPIPGMYHRGAGCFLRGLLCRVMPMVWWPLWFVIPCYAMVGWKSLISGDFPSDQGTGPEQQGTIWDKE